MNIVKKKKPFRPGQVTSQNHPFETFCLTPPQNLSKCRETDVRPAIVLGGTCQLLSNYFVPLCFPVCFSISIPSPPSTKRRPKFYSYFRNRTPFFIQVTQSHFLLRVIQSRTRCAITICHTFVAFSGNILRFSYFLKLYIFSLLISHLFIKLTYGC